MNLLEMMRRRRLFGLNNPPSTDTFGVGGQANRSGLFNQIPIADVPLNPPNRRGTPHLDEFKKHLAGAPSREDYRLNKTGNILAGIAGVAEGATRGASQGINTFQTLAETPYARASADYESRSGRLKDLAELEYQGMTDAQKQELQIRESERQDRELELKEIEANARQAKDAADIARINAQTQATGISFDVDETSGNIVMRDAKTGVVKDLGFKVKETPGEKDTRTRNMFIFEEGERQKNRISLEGIRTNNAKALENLRTANDRDLEKFRKEITREDKELERNLALMTPAAQKSAYELAVSQVSTDFGADRVKDMKPEEFATEVRTRLGSIRSRAAGQITLPESQAPTINLEPNGEVNVIAPDGTPGTIPANQLEQALREGFRRAS